VPYYDWDGVLDEDGKREYMRMKLAAAGAPFRKLSPPREVSADGVV
jgi:hypothetical protein